MPKRKSTLWTTCCRLASRLCSKPQSHRFRVSVLRGCSTVNSSLTGAEPEGRELPSLMRQVAQSKQSSQQSLSLRGREEARKKQLSLASGRSFYRMLMTKHRKRSCFPTRQRTIKKSPSPHSGFRLRVAESREVQEKLPVLRPRLNTA